MKSIFNIGIILIIILCGLAFNSCEKKEVPILTTSEVGSITGTTAICGGIITDEGTSTALTRGVCWSTGTTPTTADNKTTDGAGAGTFTSNITGLNGGTTYYVRAYATNSAGTGYGMAMLFKTLGQAPAAITLATTSITSITAQLNGSVNANYLSTDVTFEYGITTSYGSTITASQSPVTGNTNTNVSADISGLIVYTTYHYRVKAVNELGTTYGNDNTFITEKGIIFNPNLAYGSVSDNDGNTYKTIQIGTQIWMAENLKTTQYSNGDIIGTTIPATLDISGESTPKYQWAYNGDENNVANYGRLYTWHVATDSRNVCPTGWHVPTKTEWTTLITFLGGEDVAGGKMKEVGTIHWLNPAGATNESGFTAVGGGWRSRITSTVFGFINYDGRWWSSTEKIEYPEDGWNIMVNFYYNWGIISSSWKEIGFSIRCVKD